MNLESLSAADAAKFYWMRYSSDRSTIVTVKAEKVKISKNDLFGVRELRGKHEDEIILTTGLTFRLAIDKSERLMDKAKEFKGKTPVIKKPVKTKPKQTSSIKIKPSPKPPTSQKSVVSIKPAAKEAKVRTVAVPTRTQRYSKILPVASITAAAFRKALPSLRDDAEQLDFKSWCVTQVLNNTGTGKTFTPAVGSALVRELRSTPIGGVAKHPTITVPVKQKPTVTKLVADDDSDEGPVKVRMDRLELPEEDDFTDTELPEEFRQYTRSESKSKKRPTLP